MIRYEIAKQISERMNNSLNRTAIEIVLLHLEEMQLIKFETERESVIREAEKYTRSAVQISSDTVEKMSHLIKRLVSLLK